MILSQRYPTVFNGIVLGDPAMRTGLSNLAISEWIPVAYNQAAPKDASGKPEIASFSQTPTQALHGCADEEVRRDGWSGGWNDLRSPGLPFRSRGACLQARPERRMHCSGKDCGYQEGFLPARRTPMALRCIRAFCTTQVSRSMAPRACSLSAPMASSARIQPRQRST